MNFNDRNRKVRLKIDGFPKEKEYNNLIFGRKLEYRSKLDDFKASAKKGWVSIKRQKDSVALKEFIKLNDVKEYYCSYDDGPDRRDDSFEIFWR